MANEVFGTTSGSVLKDISLNKIANFLVNFTDWDTNSFYVGQSFKLNLKLLTAKYKNLPFTTTSTFGSLSGTNKWTGGVLAPNGAIYGIPRDSTTVLKIDPTTDTASTFGSLSGTSKWIGGVLAPNGAIYGIPYDSTTVLKIDPTTDTASTFGSLSGTLKWQGGVLAPNGAIYGIPFSSTTVLKIYQSAGFTDTLPNNMVRSRFLNKY